MSFWSVGSDPGYRNYGYAVVETAVRGKLLVRVHEVGMFAATITNLTAAPLRPPKSKRRKTRPEEYEAAFPDQLAEFEAGWDELFAAYPRVGAYTAERFQTRGIKGKSIECVSVMNGVACSRARAAHVPCELITASTWKNNLNRHSELTGWYGRGLSDHTVDSLWIAVYGALRHFNIGFADVDYTYLARQLQRYEA